MGQELQDQSSQRHVVRRPDPRNRSRVDRWRGVSLLEEDAAERSPLREGGGDPVVGVVAELAHLGDVGRASGIYPVDDRST